MLLALGFVLALLVETLGEGYPRLWLLGSDPSPVTQFHIWLMERTDLIDRKTFWLGVPVLQCPFDLAVEQEIIYETKPDVIIETGTYKGGSAYYFASLFELLGRGRVLTIDIKNWPDRPQHPRITYLLGSSTSREVFDRVKASIRPGERVMVFLDSIHPKNHVLSELILYSSLVTPGGYLIVYDTDWHGRPIWHATGPSAGDAVDEFLSFNPSFVRDRSREKYGVTLSPGGYLRHVQADAPPQRR
jgi:cephalosporin hydroxylase